MKVDDVWVDGIKGEQFFHNMKIKNFNEVLISYEKFNVILGHSCYDLGEKLKKNNSQINEVYYLFSPCYELYNKIPYEQIEKEIDRLYDLYIALEDDKSRESLIAYINVKMTGNVNYVFDTHDKNSTFYNNDAFVMNDHERFLDIGAYNGDTIIQFLNETDGKYDAIYAIEPDQANYKALNDFIKESKLENIMTSDIGAWDCKTELHFRTGNEQISSVDIDENILRHSEMITIPVDRIDNIFAEEKMTYIKINYYEGVYEAIKGAEKIILSDTPKLGIDVGFDLYNVLLLSEYIRKINPSYKLFLRFNRAVSVTLTLYATV